MTLEGLAKQGREKIYSSLAGRNYNEIISKRSSLMLCFSKIEEIEHKREFVAKIKEISFVNDARSINANSTWFTMENITNRIVWILDIDNTEMDFTLLFPICREKVGNIICFGANKEKGVEIFNGLVSGVYEVNNIQEAVIFANAIAENDDVVLYSPANGNREDVEIKGNAFRKAVNEI